jgi:plastocyanin
MVKTRAALMAVVVAGTVIAASLASSLGTVAGAQSTSRSAADSSTLETSSSAATVQIVNSGGTCTNTFCYKPGNITVLPGTTVTWKNATGVEHTVTRCTASACPTGPGTGTDPAFNSGLIAPTGSFSVTFTGLGIYDYYCAVHGYNVMHGLVKVSSFFVTTKSLPAGSTGTPYSATLKVAGGTAPYFWSLKSGSLPTGLTLSSSGTISGTPTATGTFAFTVKVTDSSTPTKTASKNLSITVT